MKKFILINLFLISVGAVAVDPGTVPGANASNNSNGVFQVVNSIPLTLVTNVPQTMVAPPATAMTTGNVNATTTSFAIGGNTLASTPVQTLGNAMGKFFSTFEGGRTTTSSLVLVGSNSGGIINPSSTTGSSGTIQIGDGTTTTTPNLNVGQGTFKANSTQTITIKPGATLILGN